MHVFISYKPLQCTQGASNILLISKDRFVKMIHCRILACTQRRRKVHTYVPTIQKCNRPVSTHSVIKISSIHPYNHIHHQKSLKIISESSWMKGTEVEDHGWVSVAGCFLYFRREVWIFFFRGERRAQVIWLTMGTATADVFGPKAHS